MAIPGLTSSAYGGNFIATGHDMDWHCYKHETVGETNQEECPYLKIVVDKVRNGSTAKILALDPPRFGVQQLKQALANAGYAAGEVETVDPSKAAFKTLPFVDASGAPIYSAIVTASDEVVGADMSEAGETEINKRASDFKTYFNAGGGILALSGGNSPRLKTYYNFVPLTVTAVAVGPPFTVTPEGAKLGITDKGGVGNKGMANCCLTHNSFNIPPCPLVILEKDKENRAETIAAFETTISDTGAKFECLTTSLSGEAKSGATISVKEKAPVTDNATLLGEHAKEATGKVEYKVYSDNQCTTLVAEAGTVDVTAGTIPSSTPETLAPGTYYWRASYSGDAQNAALETACGSEVETVKTGRWGVNGVQAAEGMVISWGTLALRTVLGGGGEVTCHTVGAGTIENPKGGGPGSGTTQAFAAFDCESTSCPFTSVLTAQSLPWPSVLEPVGSKIRLKTAGMNVTSDCQKEGKSEGSETFVGATAPNAKHGTSALHPGFFEYDAGAGTLEKEGSVGSVLSKIEGETKILGYNEQELINASLTVPRFL
ncbi:MAG TPA: hypothetical protein VGW98_03470 [Solirubrobacteraceae bacterium]|nr:hypothetical protein [Solirubrobacteraceae bacterium]